MYSCIQFKKKDYRTKIIEHNSYIFNYIFRLIKDTTTQRTSREENKGDRNTRDSETTCQLRPPKHSLLLTNRRLCPNKSSTFYLLNSSIHSSYSISSIYLPSKVKFSLARAAWHLTTFHYADDAQYSINTALLIRLCAECFFFLFLFFSSSPGDRFSAA